MKLKELENLDCTFIYPADVAELLECNPQDVRQSIKEGTFGFECIRIGNTTKIYRCAFIKRWKELTQ